MIILVYLVGPVKSQKTLKVGEGTEERCDSKRMVRDATLLALKMEEGNHRPRYSGSLYKWKRVMDHPLDLQKDTGLLTP
jgi:hypothetical protein